jgi:hypothetical protein
MPRADAVLKERPQSLDSHRKVQLFRKWDSFLPADFFRDGGVNVLPLGVNA